DKYDESGTAFGVLRYLREHDVKLPRRSRGALLWQDATETIIMTMLHHPMYAGAYAYGRRQTTRQVDAAGRLSSGRRLRPMDDWKVLLSGPALTKSLFQ